MALDKRWLSVFILCFINLINYMDRYTVAGVLDDVGQNCESETWDLGDDEKGLIQTSFVICYFASAPIFGFLGDRYSRKWLMAFGVLAWGICTLASSFMPSFIGFLLLRSAIGFGESGFTSLAPTVLGDLFDSAKRSIVLALFYFAIPVGSGLGYVVGSQVAQAADCWRWGVRVTPILNILALVLLVVFMMDPPRGENEAQSKKINQEKEERKGFGHQLASWGDDLMYLLKNKSYMFSTAAFTCLTFCTGALSWFGPNFVMTALKVRKEYQLEGYENDIKEDDVGIIFGVILSAAGIVGLMLGSGLSLWLRKKIAWIDPVICGAGLLISCPLIFAALYISDQSVLWAFILMFIGQVFLNMNWAVVVDISLYVVIPLRRSTAEAFQLMASHAFGEAGSPYLTGVISEDGFKSRLDNTTHSHYNSSVLMSENEKDFVSMQKALYFSLGFELLGAALFLLTGLFVVSDRAKAEEAERKETEKFAMKPSPPSRHASTDFNPQSSSNR